jgi:hypothetical protein
MTSFPSSKTYRRPRRLKTAPRALALAELPPPSCELPSYRVGTRMAARWLGVTTRTVRRWCERGVLDATRYAYCGHWLIDPRSITAIRQQPASER